MNVTVRHVAGLASAAMLLALAQSPPTQSAGSRDVGARTVPDELIVGFERGAPEAARARALERVSARIRKRYDRIGAVLVSVPGGQAHARGRLLNEHVVRYVESNAIVRLDDQLRLPADPSFGEQWGLDNTGQPVGFVPGTPDADIDAPEAWGVTTGSAGVVVAVIDTGIDLGHPDLAANLWTNAGENCAGCRNNGVDDDRNGYVDDWRGWDFLNRDADPSDDHGHGTHVAGTIGAVGDNRLGVTGVDWSVSLMPLKFIGPDGSGTVADAVSAILYAAANGARVLNASWGESEFSQALLDAIRVADADGSLFVAAAGNSYSDTDVTPNYPSAYDVPNLIAVAATDNRDQRAWFSNYGARSADLGAPGVGILSTWPGASYESLDGTSMAAPHVSGAAALVAAASPLATAVGIKALLLRTVDPVPSLSGKTTTGGRLNANGAVRCTASPKVWIDQPQGSIDVFAGDTLQLSVLAGVCAEPGGVAVSASAGGAPIMLTARGDGLYSGAYMLAAPGAFTIEVSASAAGASDGKTISGIVSPSYAITPGGAPVTVTTSVPGQRARLKFSGGAGQRVSLRIGSGTMTQEKVSLASPDRSTVFSATLGNSGFVDVATLPVDGDYSIVVDPYGTNVGSLTVTLFDVPPDAGGSIVPGGGPVSVAAAVPGQNARLVFSGSVGQRVSLGLGAGTMSQEKVSLLAPDGSTIVSTTLGNSGFVDVRSLAVSGTYALLVDPVGANVGSATLTLYDVPPDVAATVVPGGPSVAVTATVPGQNARLSFSGSVGQRVSLALSGGTIGQEKVSLLAPDGSTIVSTTLGNSGFVDARSLAVSGQYALLVDPVGTNVGSLTVTLFDVPPDAGGSIVPGGGPVSVAAAVPGQNARLVFSGSVGQRVSVGLGAGTMSQEKVSLLAPDGSTIVSTTLGNSGFVDVRSLAVSGTYALLVDPVGANVGSATLTLYDVPPDVAATVVLGGPSVTVTTGVPGQNGSLSFSGSAGQRISLALSGGTMTQEKVSLIGPDGATLFATTFGNSGFVDVRTLTATGGYVLALDPAGANAGSITLTLYDVPADVSGAILAGGASVTVTATVPGQNARLGFSGSAGQAVNLKLSGVTLSTVKISILNPDGSALLSRTYGTYGGSVAFTLPSSGAYTVVIDPQANATGSTTLTLT